jgi:two-component system OmpR family response regulator
MRVLIVEDDTRISSFIAKGLRAEGYTCDVVESVEAAEPLIARSDARPDLMLLDLGLPGEDGGMLLTRLRGRGDALPVIVLTARSEVRDRVRGLDAGANDYVVKPFAFDELLARIRACQRTAQQPSSTELAVDDLRLDLLSKVAWRGGRRIDLAPREWALLELFMRQPTRVFTRAHILSSVWEYGSDPGTNVVDVYVGYLRKKLNAPGAEPLIHTVRGAGYRLVNP